MTESTLPEVPFWNDVDFAVSLDAADGHVAVCFEAGWCAVSQTQSRLVRMLAAELAEDVSFARLDVDKSPQTAQRFGISSLPTIVLFADGQPVGRLIGQNGREACLSWLTRQLERR